VSENKSEDFQKKVSHLIIRNKNILDILTKCQNSCGKICRSTVKSATGCGCIKILGEKSFPAFSEKELKEKSSGTEGKLCPECKSIIESEIGEMLFYIAGLCNALNISMKDVMKKEIKNVEMLGKYSLR